VPRGPLAILALALALAGAAAAAPAGSPGPDASGPAAEAAAPPARELVRRAEAQLRGAATVLAARMTVAGAALSAPRVVDFRAWDDRRRDRAFVRVLGPAKDAGTGFLRLPPNVWRYVPRLERTSLVPRKKLLARWLGSDSTLDDWLHASSEEGDYEHRVVGSEDDADGRAGVRAWVVDSRRLAGAAVAWERVRRWIDADAGVPLRREFYTADGRRVRTVRFLDVREVSGRSFPHLWVMTPAGEPGRETRVVFQSVVFPAALDDDLFAARRLKARRAAAPE